MTPDQSAAILDSLRAGVPLERAARAARVTPAAVDAHAEADEDFADQLEAAKGIGAGARARAATPPAKVPAPPPRTAGGTGGASSGAGAREPSTPRPRAAPAADPDRIDLGRIAREAASLGPGRLGYYLWLDAKIAAHGSPPTSPFWLAAIGEFFATEKTWIVASVGRGGGKSTTLVRVSVAQALFEPRQIPPGQRWIWPFISISTSDAARRIGEIVAALAAAGVTPDKVLHSPTPTIELDDARGNAIAFVSLATTIAGVSGPSTIGSTIDEEAKLRDKATNANPSTEILASLVQTSRARAGWRGIRCSSAWTEDGSHPASVREGDTEEVFLARLGPFVHEATQGLAEVATWEEKRGNVADGAKIRAHIATLTPASAAIPTWVANPTISPMASRKMVDAIPAGRLDGLSRTDYWLRENASVPMRTGLGLGARADQLTGLAEATRNMLDQADSGARGLEARLREYERGAFSDVSGASPWMTGPRKTL